MKVSESRRVPVFVVIVTAFGLYFGEICRSLDLEFISNTSIPFNFKSKLTLDDSTAKSEIKVAYMYPRTAAGKEIFNTSLQVNDNHSGLLELAVTGQIYTDKGFHSKGEKVQFYSSSLGKRYVTNSDSTGNFRIRNIISANDYQLQISPKGMYQKYYKEISITPASTHFHILLETAAVSTLRGQLKNLDKIPVVNFKLKVKSLVVSNWERFLTTDSIGGFELENVPVGGITFSAIQDQQVLSIEGFEILDKQHRSLNLIVDEGSYVINGIVYNHYGEPVIGSNIVLSWKHNDGRKRSTTIRSTTTGLDGRFQLQRIGPGLHELIVADIISGSAHKQVIDFSYDYTEVLINLE